MDVDDKIGAIVGCAILALVVVIFVFALLILCCYLKQKDQRAEKNKGELKEEGIVVAPEEDKVSNHSGQMNFGMEEDEEEYQKPVVIPTEYQEVRNPETGEPPVFKYAPPPDENTGEIPIINYTEPEEEPPVVEEPPSNGGVVMRDHDPIYSQPSKRSSHRRSRKSDLISSRCSMFESNSQINEDTLSPQGPRVPPKIDLLS